jgi:hypothetical protein
MGTEGAVVVLTLNVGLSPEAVARVKDRALRVLPDDVHDVLVLSGGVALTTVLMPKQTERK